MRLVLDASAWVDLLLDTERGLRIRERIAGADLHAPAHVDIEMLSALGRLHRAGALSEGTASDCLRLAQRTPIQRHPLHPLTTGAWARRHNLRLTDAYYVELADNLDTSLITTDQRLARAAPRTEAF
jgi:predicted nucleic acid-binding protein